MTREEREKAIEYFKFHRKIFCDDFLKIYPENSIAYQATLIEKSFHDMAIKALEQEDILDKLDEIITDALDNSTDQKESQTLRWVLDKISEVT